MDRQAQIRQTHTPKRTKSGNSPVILVEDLKIVEHLSESSDLFWDTARTWPKAKRPVILVEDVEMVERLFEVSDEPYNSFARKQRRILFLARSYAVLCRSFLRS